MKEETKTRLKIMIAILMVLIMFCWTAVVDAYRPTTGEKGFIELFKEDMLGGETAMNWDASGTGNDSKKYPTDMLKIAGVYPNTASRMWSIDEQGKLYDWMKESDEFDLATNDFYDAWEERCTGREFWNENHVMYQYRRNETMGLVKHAICTSLKNAYISVKDSLTKNHSGNVTTEVYTVGEETGRGNTYVCDNEGNHDYIKNLDENLPGLGKPVRHSVRYEWIQGDGAFGAIHEKYGLGGFAQAVLYCITQKEYGYGETIKQQAIWNILNGTNYSVAKNLSDIALKYQEFQGKMHDDQGSTKQYADNMNVNAPWSTDSNKKVDPKSGKHESKVDGVDYDTGVYGIQNLGYTVEYETDGKGNIVEDKHGNKIRNKYILGPYNIDYTFNDMTDDTYTDGGREHKLNAVENVWVITNDGTVIGTKSNQMYPYHKDGCYIEVVKSRNGGDPIMTRRINDKKYDAMCDGELINGFESGEDFYIIVHRGNLDIESFLSVEAQVDFQYIDTVTGIPTGAGLFEYEGKLVEWYWDKNEQNPIPWLYLADTVEDVHRSDPHGGCSDWTRYSSKPRNGQVDTVIYTLNRREVGDAMRLVAQSGEFERKYNHYSVRMPGEYNPEEEYPDILIEKYDKDTGERLYGAEFRIDVTVNGTDRYGYSLREKTLHFYRTTDRYGRARITGRELVSSGAQIALMKDADVRIRITETKAPAGYEKLKDSYTASFSSRYGKITSVTGGQKDRNQNQIIIQAHNRKIEGNPKIQIIKVDKNNNPIVTNPSDLWQETMFKIHVKYQRGEERNGDIRYTEALVDNPLNIIRGQTNYNTGIFNITYDDFRNMPQRFRLYR